MFKVGGVLENTGHDLTVTLDQSSRHAIYLSDGPLSYKYRVDKITLHYGMSNKQGSEHMINGKAFPAEVTPMIPTQPLTTMLSITCPLLSTLACTR